jgi:iron complex outermembrane receptor protein
MDGDTVPSWYGGHNYHRTDSWGAEFNAEYKSALGTTSIGADYRNEEIRSNVLGEPLTNPEKVTNEHASAFYSRFEDRTNVSLYAEHSAQFKKWMISGGLLYNLNTDFDDEVFPGLDVAYQLNSNWRLYASANRSVRFPTYTDLYYNRGGAVGSIDLTPEESINYELGTKFFSSKITGNIALFRREGTNLIDWIRFNGSDVTQAANITTVNVNGAEIDATIPLSNWLENSFIKKVRISYTYLRADSTSQNFESNYVLDFLQHKFNLKLTQSVSDQISIDWRASYQDRLGGYFNTSLGKEVPFDPILLVDARITHHSEKFKLFFEVANVLNEDYVDIGNVPQPGRWMRLGLVFNTGFGKQ